MEPIGTLLADALVRVARIAALIGAGVFAANLAVEFGVIERVAALSRFLTGPANLPAEVGTAILTTAASTTAGYGMLADYRESGRIDDRQTLIAVATNTFFGFVQHVFTFYAPVLIPILGLRVGVTYVGARAAIALGITLAGVAGGALLLSPSDAPDGRDARDGTGAGTPESDGATNRDGEGDETASNGEGDGMASDRADDADASRRAAARAALSSTQRTLRRVLPRLTVVYTLVVVGLAYVDLRALSELAGPLSSVAGLPAVAAGVIVVFAFDTTAGAATIAPMVGETFTPEGAVATMLLGGIVSFAVSTFRRSIPFQYGVWGPAFGSKVVVLNTALKLVFIGAAVTLLLAL